ncbi:MAG: RNA polymerase sigma-70 factor [Candidatus Symbiothrix sp.]|jgi:RNA polymerase sigma-70 factor (ECF subfamily)|nr:RNA polymerase sigma-70 factor [Candidatus Symbiothrix sp.]
MDEATYLKIFNRLYSDYRDRFICFAHSYTKDLAVAEDITSDAFVQFWANRTSIPSNENLPAYILTTVKNKCLNYLRHLKIADTAAEDIKAHSDWALQMRISTLEACEPTELFGNEVREIIRKTLDAMPEQTRRIFVMSRYQNKTYLEIAGKTGLTVKGVEFHISKALKLLRISLKDYFPIFLCFFLNNFTGDVAC